MYDCTINLPNEQGGVEPLKGVLCKNSVPFGVEFSLNYGKEKRS